MFTAKGLLTAVKELFCKANTIAHCFISKVGAVHVQCRVACFVRKDVRSPSGKKERDLTRFATFFTRKVVYCRRTTFDMTTTIAPCLGPTSSPGHSSHSLPLCLKSVHKHQYWAKLVLRITERATQRRKSAVLMICDALCYD